jgi:hypothetical protein
MVTGVMQHNYSPCEHAGIISLYGNTKVSEDSTIVLCIGGDVKVLEHQHQQSIDVS